MANTPSRGSTRSPRRRVDTIEVATGRRVRVRKISTLGTAVSEVSPPPFEGALLLLQRHEPMRVLCDRGKVLETSRVNRIEQRPDGHRVTTRNSSYSVTYLDKK